MTNDATSLIAVDIGNSRIKLGRFRLGEAPVAAGTLPPPSATFDLPISDRSGQFDVDRLANWSSAEVDGNASWMVASVHRGAAERFVAAVAKLAAKLGTTSSVRRLTLADVPMEVHVEQPERVGVDRVLAAFAADRLRRPGRAAVVVDLGSAITVDLVSAAGTFEGGAILPGISMSAKALAEQTDALPRVAIDHLDHPPSAPGKSTIAAIEAGLYWGAVGATRELTRLYAAGERLPPDLFLTGGASAQLVDVLATTPNNGEIADARVLHVPHLVLAGIALASGLAENCRT